jgi:diguanylate cyclase (GGDEF)-like protein
MREIDLLGRYGGEEFSVLLPESELNRAHKVAERLRLCTADVPIDTNQGPLIATISLGIAPAEGCKDLLAPLNRADAALYLAKQAGRNRVEA